VDGDGDYLREGLDWVGVWDEDVAAGHEAGWVGLRLEIGGTGQVMLDGIVYCEGNFTVMLEPAGTGVVLHGAVLPELSVPRSIVKV
jgi:hypothetical protein